MWESGVFCRISKRGGKGGQLFGVAETVRPVDLLLALEQDAGLIVLKDDVGEGVAVRDLPLDLGVKIVLGVFGFPVAARQAVAVAQGAVRANDRAAGLSRKLGDEGPVLQPGGLLEQGLEGRTHAHLVKHTLRPQGCDVFVIPANGAMRGSNKSVGGHNFVTNTSTLAGGGPSTNAL